MRSSIQKARRLVAMETQEDERSREEKHPNEDLCWCSLQTVAKFYVKGKGIVSILKISNSIFTAILREKIRFKIVKTRVWEGQKLCQGALGRGLTRLRKPSLTSPLLRKHLRTLCFKHIICKGNQV